MRRRSSKLKKVQAPMLDSSDALLTDSEGDEEENGFKLDDGSETSVRYKYKLFVRSMRECVQSYNDNNAETPSNTESFMPQVNQINTILVQIRDQFNNDHLSLINDFKTTFKQANDDLQLTKRKKKKKHKHKHNKQDTAGGGYKSETETDVSEMEEEDLEDEYESKFDSNINYSGLISMMNNHIKHFADFKVAMERYQNELNNYFNGIKQYLTAVLQGIKELDENEKKEKENDEKDGTNDTEPEDLRADFKKLLSKLDRYEGRNDNILTDLAGAEVVGQANFADETEFKVDLKLSYVNNNNYTPNVFYDENSETGKDKRRRIICNFKNEAIKDFHNGKHKKHSNNDTNFGHKPSLIAFKPVLNDLFENNKDKKSHKLYFRFTKNHCNNSSYKQQGYWIQIGLVCVPKKLADFKHSSKNNFESTYCNLKTMQFEACAFQSIMNKHPSFKDIETLYLSFVYDTEPKPHVRACSFGQNKNSELIPVYSNRQAQIVHIYHINKNDVFSLNISKVNDHLYNLSFANNDKILGQNINNTGLVPLDFKKYYFYPAIASARCNCKAKFKGFEFEVYTL